MMRSESRTRAVANDSICDVSESAAAILFCAADEAALCQSCGHKSCCRLRCVGRYDCFRCLAVLEGR
ncbi:unnamed protein product [Rhodiola kirilowii]